MLDVKKTYILSWEGKFPELGDYLKTPAGSVYVVIESKLNTLKNAKSVGKLTMLKLSEEEISHLPSDTYFFGFQWGYKRRK